MNYKECKSVEIPQEINQEKSIIVENSILDLIKLNPSISRREMEKTLNLTHNQVKYAIEKLKNKKIITRVDSTKAGYWKILK